MIGLLPLCIKDERESSLLLVRQDRSENTSELTGMQSVAGLQVCSLLRDNLALSQCLECCERPAPNAGS